MLDVTGEARIYVHVNGKGKDKRTNYTTCIGSKQIDKENWINLFAPVNFSKRLQDEVPDLKDGDNFDVLINAGWISPWEDKDKKLHPALFINKAKIVK